MSRLPPDWGRFWTFCSVCGARYHESETHACDVEDDEEEEDDDDE